MAATKLPNASKTNIHPGHEDAVGPLTRYNPSDEAPDWGDPEPEAPEDRLAHTAEAPDAGDSRGYYIEAEFTQGRSQS